MPPRARSCSVFNHQVFLHPERRSTSISLSCHSLAWGVLCPLQCGKSILQLKLLRMLWVTMSPLCSNWLACSLSVTVCDIQTNEWIQKWESLFIMFSFAPHMGFQCSIFQNVILLRKTKNNKTNKTPRYNKSTHRKHK